MRRFGTKDAKLRLSQLAPLASFMGIKILVGLLLLKLSAACLSVPEFATFSQLFQFAVLLNTLSVGGAQNGIIRQAAAERANDEGMAIKAGLAIWAGVSLVAVFCAFACATPISRFLTDDPQLWWMIPAVTLASLMGGPGQVFCSALTGSGRPATSLWIQTVGLIGSGCGAGIALLDGSPLTAVLAFALGPIATSVLGYILLPRRIGRTGRIAPVLREAKSLLRYSAAFTILALLNAAVPFTLRYFYRSAFGPILLGYWLASLRVSDINTQVVSLYLTQYFITPYTKSPHSARARIQIRNAASILSFTLMTLVSFVFLGKWVITALLSADFENAKPFILTNLVGDVFRTLVSLAMFTAFAERKLGRYVGIEAAALAIFAAGTLYLILCGFPKAPQIAYPITYAAGAALVIGFWARNRALHPHDESTR